MFFGGGKNKKNYYAYIKAEDEYNAIVEGNEILIEYCKKIDLWFKCKCCNCISK